MAKEKICGIYCIENLVNGKRYIGQSQDIECRWKCHKIELNKNRHHNCHLQRAWNKYGQENFKFSILTLCTTEELDNKECYYIDLYKTTDLSFGYNLDSGGNLNKTHSKETRLKISLANSGERNGMYGKHHTAEWKKYISENYSGVNSATYGMKHTDETKEKIRQKAIGRIISKETRKKLAEANIKNGHRPPDWATQKARESVKKKVVQYSLDGQKLNIYNSITEASKALGICTSTIIEVCRGNGYTAGGYIWRYAKDAVDIISPILPYKRKVEQLDLNDNLLKTYDSLTDAANQNGVSTNIIYDACKGFKKTAIGYKWRYQKNEKGEIPELKVGAPKNSVVQYALTGEKIKTFKSIVEASLSSGVERTSINAVCLGKQMTAGDFQWRFHRDNIESLDPIKKQVRAVCQYDLQGNFIKQYVNRISASQETGIDKEDIFNVCWGGRREAGGYMWKFA